VSDPVQRAIANAHDLRAAPRIGGGPYDALGYATYAIGDPQSNTQRFFGALAAHGLLGDDGWLRRDVRLIAMGDYFDYYVPEREAARVEGVLVLAWLAAHPREQVPLLAGNHDLARVMELVSIDDARFREAGDLAREIYDLPHDRREARTDEFRARFPELATTGYAGRDYNAFTVEQRVLVQRLLVAGRFSLALEELVGGIPTLFTHAGVTNREVAALGVHTPHEIAYALNLRLDAAVRAVAGDWAANKPTALSLEPLHVAGADGKEGGGLLYHRPADPERPGADPDWELSATAPRRFDPRNLPRGLTQAVGHTGHSKAWKEMPHWREPGMTGDRGGLRTLRVSNGSVTYRRGIHRGDPDDAIVWMLDPEMHYVPTPGDVAILDLSAPVE